MNPVVSVIVAARNEEQRVGSALKSVLMQSLQDFEVIVVDDASTDQTVEVLNTFARLDPRIVVLSTATRFGRAQARNWGIEKARAELIAILDADDFMMPTRLEEQVRYIQANNAIGMLGTWAYYQLRESFIVESRTPTDDAALRRKLSWGIMPFVHVSMMFKRELVLAAGGYIGYPGNYNEDYYLCVRLVACTKAAVIPIPLVVYSTDGLLDKHKLHAKQKELAELERYLLHKNFSVARLVSLLMRKSSAVVPGSVYSHLTDRRLRHWPTCSPAETESIRNWISTVEGSLELM